MSSSPPGRPEDSLLSNRQESPPEPCALHLSFHGGGARGPAGWLSYLSLLASPVSLHSEKKLPLGAVGFPVKHRGCPLTHTRGLNPAPHAPSREGGPFRPGRLPAPGDRRGRGWGAHTSLLWSLPSPCATLLPTPFSAQRRCRPIKAPSCLPMPPSLSPGFPSTWVLCLHRAGGGGRRG